MEAIGHMKQSLCYKIFTTQEAFSCVIIIFFFPPILEIELREWRIYSATELQPATVAFFVLISN